MARFDHHEDVLLAPILTEETWQKMEERKYSFRVALGANKIQIRKAVENLFDVRVEKVWTANRRGKPRRERLSQLHGRTPHWRKAIVRLAAGDRIDMMGG
jgi:large subunit ribosomal protein L23